MRAERDYLDELARLHRQTDPAEQRATWRQSMATLAAAVTNQRRPVPLEGLDPEALLQSVRTALANDLVDDVEWLSPPAAAAALYELAAALPHGRERRDLGRRVLRRMHDGDAATFAALATQVALGSRRALSGAPIRARVALALDLPIGAGARVDALALALISRRELEREWLRIPSTGSLPARRLAARLLERAARETAKRAAEGDDSGVRVFQTDSVQLAWRRLLGDRESLVWRHVATARGLLSWAMPELADEVQRHLDPSLSPTEWRRAAASLAASIALDPEGALTRSRQLLDSGLLQHDPGLAGAMIFGLPRAAEAHPAAVEELLEQLVRVGGLDALDALVALRREQVGREFGGWAAELGRAQLREALEKEHTSDDGRVALREALADELAQDSEREQALSDHLAGALRAFAERGAREAYEQAQHVLERARERVAALETCADDEPAGRRSSFRALRELDLALCESDTLGNLLLLGARGDEPGAVVRPLGDLFERMTNWLVLREGEPVVAQDALDHVALRMRRLRTLLHLVDADGSLLDDRPVVLRQRRLLAARVLLRRVRQEGQTQLRRALCAATARGGDALVREEVAELSDVLIAAANHIRNPDELHILSEASMVPDVEETLRALAQLHRATAAGADSGRALRQALDALFHLANELPVASSARVEALRGALLQLGHALEHLAAAGSVAELTGEGGKHALLQLEESVHTLAQLVVGARRRLEDSAEHEAPASGAAIRLLDHCLERALRSGRAPLADAIESAVEALELELPPPIARLAVRTLERLGRLPVEAPPTQRTSFLPVAPKEAPLPPWMPPSRVLGGFYVLRALGAGAVGSVFVARRAEQRRDPRGERLALKVPEYDAAAARTLSEAEFMRLFREEAGALLALPEHPNLARFVTFDAGARPKPILVMELVEGVTLERVLQTGELDMTRALELLDGLAAGLEAMHAAGIGHLDVKPSNVILRDGGGAAAANGEPVLVDFGLAGRHVRPGCATAEFGAPEIWRQDQHTVGWQPMPADVYAFGCLIFEVLTGRTLFEGPHEMALISAHMQHDGNPPGLVQLQQDPITRPIAELLRPMLRRSPAARATMRQVREGLATLRQPIGQQPWPLSTPGASVAISSSRAS